MVLVMVAVEVSVVVGPEVPAMARRGRRRAAVMVENCILMGWDEGIEGSVEVVRCGNGCVDVDVSRQEESIQRA